MGVIKRLPEIVANQISAGEVIERPASIVKELVENSIDAGSKEITIEVENGGRDSIRVKDDGKGIAEDDLELAFDRYATSKIENVNDLYSIRTLGFRGEALASIASISKVEIFSRSSDSLKGSKMLLEGGEIIKKAPAGVPVGTDITIRDIFYNTPARYKYLKTIETEFGHISNIVSREAMAYPEIKFTLIHNKREVLKTPGTGNLLDAIYSIYGEELVNNLIELEYEESYVKLSGFITRPNYTRSSRNHQIFFVNKRTVYNRSLSRGVEKGYQGLIPPGRYPVVFLNLKLNQVLVDVNVHPSKREVKFSREEIIEKIIEKGVRTNLSRINTAPQLKVRKQKGDSFQEIKFDFDNYKPLDTNGMRSNTELSDDNKYFADKPYFTENKQAGGKVAEENIKKDIRNNFYREKQPEYFIYNPEVKSIPEERVKTNYETDKPPLPGINRIFGQILNTYILAEGTDGLYIIDQHNAHERVLYEKKYAEYRQQEILTQGLLVPVNIEVTLAEKEIIEKHFDLLNKLGIKIESFGSNSYIVTELPLLLKNLPGQVIVREIIDRLLENDRKLQPADLIDDLITLMSCKAAIKAGKYLDMREMIELVAELFNTENPERCPHGRPIIIHISNEDIARSMGR
ncbi:MAG: DNA mismatch repair endonuclease MutL [Halanaerobiaceae bacterium]|nr:DNA mismatch repair endonuclease MutL [Halanaerobiaceae bacterium]